MAEQDRVLAAAYGTGLPCFIDEGQGAVFTDVDGNRLLDLSGGMGCNILGFSHPDVLTAVTAQAAKLLHTDYAVVPHVRYLNLCVALCALTPGDDNKAALFNSGAEAVENAVKLARSFTGRNDLIVFDGGFHGRTALTSAMSSRPSQRAGFGASPPGVHHVAFATSPEEASPREVFDAAFRSRVSPGDVAAVVLEPVQGDGGVRAQSSAFNRELTAICRENGILLIADEVQTAFRTGSPLASHKHGLEPDLFCLGKALGGGFPLSAVVGRREIMDSAVPGAIGGTCNGNAVACAAGLAMLSVFERDHLHARARQVEGVIRDYWRTWPHECVAEVRAHGAMAAFQLGDSALTARVRQRALQQGVVTVSAGRDRDAIRLLPPLCITDTQLVIGLEILRAALVDELAGQPQ